MGFGFSFGKVKSGLKFILPMVLGGIIGEIATGRFPIEQWTKQIPFVSGLPPMVQRFVPAIAVGTATILIFSTGDLGSAKWTITSLAGSAMLGVTTNLAAKAVQKGGVI